MSRAVPDLVRSLPDVVPPAPRVPRQRSLVAVIIAACALVASSAFAYAYDHASAPHLFPGTRIGGVLVGSRVALDAQAVLHDQLVVPLTKPIRLTAPDLSESVTPASIGMHIDVSDAVMRTLLVQRRESLLNRLRHRILGEKANTALHPKLDKRTFDAFIDRMAAKINRDPQDARLVVNGEELSVVPERLGRKVDTTALRSEMLGALFAGSTDVKLPVAITQPELTASSFNNVILISTTANTLKLYSKGKLVRQFPVATGTGGYPTPLGQFEVVGKAVNPTWYNPHDPWSVNMPETIGPGPSDPLGTRALYLSASGILIHGTPQDWSIGRNASHGCIRMHMSDVQALYEMVDVGTPVLIT